MKFKLEFASKCFGVDLDYAREHLEKFEIYKISVNKLDQLYIEFNSLEELVQFMEVEGQIVLDEKTLMVHDDYIE